MPLPGLQCKAKTKSGKQCTQRAVRGREVCKVHGGMSPSAGLGHPTLKHGRYSKDLPTRLRARYQEAMADPTILELKADIAVMEARISELITKVDTGESGRLWKQLKKVHGEFDRAMRSGDSTTATEKTHEMAQIIDAGTQEADSWRDIMNAFDQRRKTVESERKRYVEMHQMITTERAMLLIGTIAQIIKDNVDDRDAYNRIAADIGRLIDSGFTPDTNIR